MPRASWKQLCNEVQVGLANFGCLKPGVSCGREGEGRSSAPPEFRAQALHRMVFAALTWSPVGIWVWSVTRLRCSHTQKE